MLGRQPSCKNKVKNYCGSTSKVIGSLIDGVERTQTIYYTILIIGALFFLKDLEESYDEISPGARWGLGALIAAFATCFGTFAYRRRNADEVHAAEFKELKREVKELREIVSSSGFYSAQSSRKQDSSIEIACNANETDKKESKVALLGSQTNGS